MSQTLTLEIPEPLYHRLKDRAQQRKRSVEDEAVDALAAGIPIGDEVSAELRDRLSELARLSNEELSEIAASSVFPTAKVARLEQLHAKQELHNLEASEAREVTALVQEYEACMLVRAQAIALLHQRGSDVSALASLP